MSAQEESTNKDVSPPTVSVAKDLETSDDCTATGYDEVALSNLTQFLGVSLRGILPYAESEVSAIHEVAQRDGDEVASEEGRAGSEAIARAHRALEVLEESDFGITDLSDDAFDDDFRVQFED